MKRLQQNNTHEISTTKKVLISANVFYFFIVLGFVLTTNYNPDILGKYTFGYFSRLLLLILLTIPFNFILFFILNGTFKILYKSRTVTISLLWRIAIVLVIFILAILLTELFLRMKPKPFIENFHPYLQSLHTKKNEGHLHVNSDNFRYDEITKEKPNNVYRIFVLGGSTVFDEDRKYEDSLVKQTENSLRKHYSDKKIQVINAGVNRYTSEHSLILYETKIVDFDPDMIVIWQGFNDMYYSCTPEFSPVKEYRNDYSHFYQVLNNIVDSYFNWQFKLISLERLAKVFSENFYADLRAKLPKPKPNISYTDNIEWYSLGAYKRNMTHIVNLAKANDVKVIIGNQANHYDNNPKNYLLAQYFCRKDNQFISTKALNKGIEKFNDTSKKIANEHEIPFVDIEAQLPKTNRYFTDDVHYTDEGSKKVAETVTKAIIDSKYLEE